MNDLFGPEGLAAIDRLARQRTLYAFDFDGTLSPIVERPDGARARTGTVDLLRALGERVPTVLLTGRAIDDLRTRIDFEPAFLVGNHGAEGLPNAGTPEAERERDAHRRVVAGWLSQLPVALGPRVDLGVVVEPKAYSLSVHYRAAKDPAAAMLAIGEAIATLDPPPRVIGGKCVFNLLPEGAPDKGRALQALVEHARADAAFFIGDDLTDEAAFVDAPPSWVTVRVGYSDESRARYFIGSQDDIERCLVALLDALRTAA